MEKLTMTIKEAADYSGIGVNRLRTIAKSENCPFVLRIGTTKTLVKKAAFEKWLENCDTI